MSSLSSIIELTIFSKPLRFKRRWCLTNINVRMVSAFNRARRREIVSLPPEKTRSTATAEPATSISTLRALQEPNQHTRDGHDVACKSVQSRKLVFPRIPPLHRVCVGERTSRAKVTIQLVALILIVVPVQVKCRKVNSTCASPGSTCCGRFGHRCGLDPHGRVAVIEECTKGLELIFQVLLQVRVSLVIFAKLFDIESRIKDFADEKRQGGESRSHLLAAQI